MLRAKSNIDFLILIDINACKTSLNSYLDNKVCLKSIHHNLDILTDITSQLLEDHLILYKN